MHSLHMQAVHKTKTPAEHKHVDKAKAARQTGALRESSSSEGLGTTHKRYKRHDTAFRPVCLSLVRLSAVSHVADMRNSI